MRSENSSLHSMTRKQSPPAVLITWLCTRCTWDFSRTEKDKAVCTMCKKSDRLQEVKREPLTPQALEQGMMRSMERLMSGLQGAYEKGQKKGINDEEEILLLETMVKAKNLKTHVRKAFSTKKNPRMHVMSMKI